VWLRHWGLTRDPFGEWDSAYVPLPSHDEAVARLVYAIERAQRFSPFLAESGLGKTTVLRQALKVTRHSSRRTVIVHAPSDGQQLLGLLADGLGLPFAIGSDRAGVWRGLARAIRTASLEGNHLLFAVDGWDEELTPSAIQDLFALMELGRFRSGLLTLIRVGRGPTDERMVSYEEPTLAIGLERLTRSEAETYVEAKLAAAGCADRVFTPRALTRLHSWSEGVPRGIDQLSTFSLMAGAVQGLELISPDVVDGVALRCLVEVNPDIAAR
jgi:general secretion pathway protein A